MPGATSKRRCEKCRKDFTSIMRLQHHLAAEHSIRTFKDIRTTRDISSSIARAQQTSPRQ